MSRWKALLASRAPRPNLLGLELEPFPYISGYGIASRVYRLNCLEPKDLFSTLGIRACQGLDILRACHVRGASRTRIEAKCGLHRTCIPNYWEEQAWSPLDLHGRWDELEVPVRTCPRCARFGYHCTLFQLPSITRCPWHHVTLQDSCPRCKEPTFARSDRTLDLGRCVCGYDSFDADGASIRMWTFPWQEAETALEQYLLWAEMERRRRHLIAVPHNNTWLEGFASLAKPPMNWNEALPDSRHLSQIIRKASNVVDPPLRTFWGWALVGAEQPFSLAPLAGEVQHRLSAVTQTLVAKIPSSAARTVECGVRRHDLSSGGDGENVTARLARFILPLGNSESGNAWLHLSSVDPNTLQMCAQLLEAVVRYLGAPLEQSFDLSPHVLRSGTLDNVTGRWRLNGALETMLARGYAQGLGILLRTHLNLPPGANTWRLPVIDLEGVEGQLDAIRIQWVPVKPPTVRRVGKVATKPSLACHARRHRPKKTRISPTTMKRRAR